MLAVLTARASEPSRGTVIVDNFNRIKKETEGTATMTPEQSQWVATMKAMVAQKPAPFAHMPTTPLRRWAYTLVTSTVWEVFIMAFIVAIVGVMACDFWGIEQVQTSPQSPAISRPAPCFHRLP